MLPLISLTEDPAAILESLQRRGATDIRATSTPTWIIGRAPSGGVFELLHWPTYAYCVTRHAPHGQHTQQFGLFPTWPEAVDYALQA
jgi:hypothetical protein